MLVDFFRTTTPVIRQVTRIEKGERAMGAAVSWFSFRNGAYI